MLTEPNSPKSHYLHTVNVEESSFIPVLRSRYSPEAEEYIELHYADYAVPFPKSKLAPFRSLSSNISDEDVSIQVPAPSRDAFFAFYSFLFNHDYPPELMQITTPYLTATVARGPPSIATSRADDPAYLINDVRMFVLGSQMSFPELRNKALERLYSMRELHSDPMAMLEEIYDWSRIENTEDRDALRKWAREFLSKEAEGSGHANILLLQQSEHWKDRFTELRKSSETFDIDCSTTEEDLLLSKALKVLGTEEDSDEDGTEETSDDDDEQGKLGDISFAELDVLRRTFPEVYSKLLEKYDADRKAKRRKEKEEQHQQQRRDDDDHGSDDAVNTSHEANLSSCIHRCAHCHIAPSPSSSSSLAHHGQDGRCVARDPLILEKQSIPGHRVTMPSIFAKFDPLDLNKNYALARLRYAP
ncbi:hypothetical protein PRK78_006647 [Emydomyces testavorans]|uniref:Uncharacterized protein n=1 Tax=Emydomyces testavorans TaxID=2070801 RepID=A0AAF0DM52_9EURO|nr:hypothetical protein PRK78_006647 [Emydomyces testavorans]